MNYAEAVEKAEALRVELEELAIAEGRELTSAEKGRITKAANKAKKLLAEDGEPAREEEPVQAWVNPERDRENWPTIIIDAEDGLPNYEFLSAHGTVTDADGVEHVYDHELQVMRGVEVQVPPSVLNMLEESVRTHYKQVTDPVTGKRKMTSSPRACIPYRCVSKGKYCG